MNIRKVAEMAGVSVATISRVLNHPEQVLPETRERVLAVMREQDYTPNWFARGLNLGKSNIISLLIPTIESSFYQQITSGIETISRSKGYAVFFCDTHSDEQIEAEYLKMAETRRIDGMILVCFKLGGQDAVPLSCDIPRVHIGKNRIGGCDTLCYIDFEEGAYRLLRHLLSLGHRTFHLILDRQQVSESEQIRDGLRHAFWEAGLSSEHFQETLAESTVQGGYIAAQRIMQKDVLPNAIVAASHEQAFGILKAAQDNGIDIPSRLALASLSDSPTCSIVTPPLTGLELPAAKLGMAAARMLFDRIENQALDLGVPQEMVLQPKVKIRRSCGNQKHIYELFD